MLLQSLYLFFFFFFFNDTATTEIYTLSLHDALPICDRRRRPRRRRRDGRRPVLLHDARGRSRVAHGRARTMGDGDRKSTRLNSSHSQISYAVFCLKKKKYDERFDVLFSTEHYASCR